METLDLKIAAATAGIVDGFEPRSWLPLSDPRGRRVLVSDGDRTVVAALLSGTGVAEAEAEDYAAALLRGLLPHTAVAFPQVIGRRTVSADQYAGAGEEIRVSVPLPGTPVSTIAFADSPALVDALAGFLAELHSADPGEIADSGLPVLDSAEERQRLLDALDAGAATGHVPSSLLTRWESSLENVATWRFFPCPVHGGLSEDALRTDGDAIAAVTDLGALHIGDPAADLAAVTALLAPDAVEAFFRTYRRLRTASDPGLRSRTELRSELTALDWLLEAHRSGDPADLADATALVQSLAALTAGPAASRGPYGGDDTAGTGTAPDQDDSDLQDPLSSPDPADPHTPDTASASAQQDSRPGDGTAPASTGASSNTSAGTSSGDAARPAVRAADVFRPTAPLGGDIDEEAAASVPTERITDPEDR
mgnify:CR=1 FL=1